MQNNNSGTEDLLNGGSSNSGNPTDPSNQSGNGNGGNSQSQAKLYSTPDGRMVTAEQLAEEHNSLYTDYHRKSQELSKLRTPSNQEPSNSALDPKDAALAAELRRLGFVQQADVDKTITEKGSEIAQSATKRSVSAVKLEEALDDLETDFDGTEGKPKVSREDVLNFIVKNPTLDLSPLQIARTIYYDQFVKWEARNLGGNPNPQLPTTETHGAQVVTPPNPPVYRFNDGSAYRAAMEILNKAK